MRKLVYLCDWLPPDFGAVGQYSLHFAREYAAAGTHVVLVGLSSSRDSLEYARVGAGRLTIVRIHRPIYDRNDWIRRAIWTFKTNAFLLWQVRNALREAEQILFTGSPPFMLHLLAPLNLLLRKRLRYRITDFYPECLLAAKEKASLVFKLFLKLTVAWRRRVDAFEVLGEDQRRRLEDIGIPRHRITLKRDPSPVDIPADVMPLPYPPELRGRALLLYSGNFGVAHDHETFLAGYRKHHSKGSGRVGLWLNATGTKADLLERAILDAKLPIYRSRPVPLDQLAQLLVTPDAHLITLSDRFVGFVMPSKVYGCIASGRDVLYVGSEHSDVHLLCAERMDAPAYQRVNVGDVDGVAEALEVIADRSVCEQSRSFIKDWPGSDRDLSAEVTTCNGPIEKY